MTEKYKSIRIVDGKPRKVVVDENGTIINKNPTEDELKGLNKFSEKSWRIAWLEYTWMDCCRKGTVLCRYIY